MTKQYRQKKREYDLEDCMAVWALIAVLVGLMLMIPY